MTLSGGIDEIRFRNEENGYTIAVLDCEGEPVVCVGTFLQYPKANTFRSRAILPYIRNSANSLK